MSTTGRVPAWKKLGLRLKYAKEVPLDEGLGGAEGGDGQAKNGIEGVNGEGEKEKETETETGKGRKRRFDEAEEEEKENNKEERNGEESAPKNKKKKRVSFTADTKVLDGEGEDTDQEPGGVAVTGENGKKKDGGVSGQQSTEEDGDDERSGSEVKKEKKKKKKEKGKKDTTSPDSPSSAPKIHETPILSYLSLYYKNRPAWKFQKNRETHLFKHVLSLEQVPAQYNAALLAYLQGLKSEGAKQRLCQTAEEVVKADIEEKTPENEDAAAEGKEEENDTVTTDYKKAVDAFRLWLSDPKEDFDNSSVSGQFDDDTRKKLEKRQRAELMFFAVQGKPFSAEKPKPAEKEARAKKLTPGQKKRKNRTAIIEISSSSESESSSSSSNSDNDDSEDEKPGKSTSKSASKSSSDSDSSSDTSSSDSDSESTSSSDSSSSSSS